MKPTHDEITLSAYLDGELDVAAMQAVDLDLETDAAARKYVLDATRAAALLRAAGNRVLKEDIPQRLFDALSPEHRIRSRRRPVIANLIRIAAFLLLGVIGFGTGMFMERKTTGNLPASIAPLPARYSQVVEAALEYNLSGKSREWRAPRGSVAVKVTPVKTYRDKAGVYYREYKLEVATDTQRSQINGLAYRTPDGKWATKVLYF